MSPPKNPGRFTGHSFTGREFDAETALYYYRARYYDSEVGRWASEDPLGFIDGPNVHAYVVNAPTRYTDPLGLTSKEKMEVTHKGQVLNKKSPWQTVKKAWDEAIKENMSPKHIKKLKGIAKVIRRGGTQGSLLPLCIVMDCEEIFNELDRILNPPDNRCIA